MKITGVILIILGILMFVFGNVTYTKKEKVVDAEYTEVKDRK